MLIRRSFKLDVLCFVFAVILFEVQVTGQVDYGDVERPVEGKLEKAAEEEGARFHWLSTCEGVPVHTDPNCTKERKRVGYLEEFYELWRDDVAVLLAEGKDDGLTITKAVGYAKQADLVVSQNNLYKCLRAENRISKKALVVHRWDKGVAVTDTVGLRLKPDPSAPVKKEVNLYDILYVYALKDAESSEGFCFVGNRPNCNVGDPELKESFLGWLPNNRVFFWNHREAMEYNKSPKARAWRNDHKRPIQFFADQDDIKANRAAIEEDLSQGDPWRYHIPRFPIISHEPEEIDGNQYLRLGVIGDSYTTSGLAATRELEADIRQALEKIDAGVANLDVLFVIDATGSMSAYYKSIRESVTRIRGGLEQGREKPIRYSVLYYRDYTEASDKDSFVEFFVDSASSTTFAKEFPHLESSGGRDNPPPFYGIDTAVKKVTWSPDSMRAVVLIGDMGNEQPDKRGFTIESVVKALDEYQCEFFAIQAQPENTGDPRIRLFNKQAEEIAQRLGIPETKVFAADGTDLSQSIMSSVAASSSRAKILRDVLAKIMDGSFVLDDAIMDSLKEAGIDYSPSTDPNGERKVTFGAHGSIIKKHFLSRLPEGIDPKVFLEKRIQHFGIAYGEQRIPQCPHASFLTRVLMLRSDFQLLTQIVATVTRRGVNQSNVSEVWRHAVTQMSGDLDQETTFDETRPLSEYMMMALGIPVKSELLNKSVVEVKRMTQEDIAKFRKELETLLDQMNYYDNEMKIDGSASERHWFIMHGRQYAWVPLELMP